MGMLLYFDPGVKQILATKKKKWIFLLLIPISIFKVFISCVLGYILLILTNYLLPKKRQFGTEKFL